MVLFPGLNSIHQDKQLLKSQFETFFKLEGPLEKSILPKADSGTNVCLPSGETVLGNGLGRSTFFFFSQLDDFYIQVIFHLGKSPGCGSLCKGIRMIWVGREGSPPIWYV